MPAGLASYVTLPNLLSAVRVPMAGALWLDPGEPRLLLPLAVAAALTDWADGAVARRAGRRAPGAAGPHDVGAWLDPLCDKIFVVSAVISLYVALQPPWPVVLLLVLRDLLVAPMVVVYRLLPDERRAHIDLRAGLFGKATTVVQFATVVAFLSWSAAVTPLAVISGALGLAAAAEYAARLRRPSV